jgi:2-polyprenyl-3-methyl-5-hydroxy-6-metoxy-1,4-benzoquinol methylase
MSDLNEFRNFVYSKYVTSGQANRDTSAIEPEEVFAGNKNSIKQLINLHFGSVPKNSSILDIGCGSGPYLYYLKKMGFQNVKGIDGSLEQVSLANSIGIPEVQHCDIFDFLNNAESKYDVVLLMDILEHMTRPELKDLFSLLDNIVHAGSTIIIHVPNAAGILSAKVRYADLTHELAFTPQSIKQLLTLFNYSNISCFQDLPALHSITSYFRRALWYLTTIGHRLLYFAESAETRPILSQNMSVRATKA